MPTLSVCSNYSSRFFFGGPYLQTDSGARYAGDAAIAQLAALTDGQRVLLMIPGFNNSADNAQASFNAITRNLTLRKMLGPGCVYEVAIGLLWPGRTTGGYWFAEPSAKHAADRLRVILGKLRPASVSIEAHSLGNLIALHANRDGGLRLKDLVLVNAAVDDEVAETDPIYRQAIASVSGNCLIVYSRNDGVLGKDYRWLGSAPRNVWGWIKRKSGGFGDQALGWSGPQHPELLPANAIPCDATSWCLSHGGARDASQFYDAWQKILEV